MSIYLLLGSNQGDRLGNVQEARRLINGRIGRLVRSSSVYLTAAWGDIEQPNFYNQVVEVSTEMLPMELLKTINEIEELLGRQREQKWGPRLIDIDILYYNDLQLETEVLTIPHPQIQNRKFTLEPLNEIAPDFIHPTLQQTQAELLKNCPDKLAVTRTDDAIHSI